MFRSTTSKFEEILDHFLSCLNVFFLFSSHRISQTTKLVFSRSYQRLSMKVFTQLHHDCHLADSDCKTLLYSMHSDFREVKMYKRDALESIRYGIISIHCKSI